MSFMIKIPPKGPNWQQVLKNNFKHIFNLQKDPVIQSLIDKTDHFYYSWDKVRSQSLPEKYNKDEVWALIKLRRSMNSSFIPVLDVHDQPFSFWLTDDIQKNIHLIDQSTGGNLALWDPGNDKKASAKFMVSSLMDEAITSSQIEGAVATIKEAKKMLLESRKPKNKSEQMIYNNFVTMQSLKEIKKKDLNIQLLLDLHTLISKDTLDEKADEGKFRSSEDNVNVETSYGDVLFTPPKADEIPERLNALIKFANDKEDKPFIHPVIKAIILHFWMAYIHPFTDGNGRLARTLFYWYVLKHEYWLFEYTSISKTILKRTTKYAYAYLHSEHDDNDLTYFINFHVNVIMDAVGELKNHIQEEREKKHLMLLEITNYPELNFRQTRFLQHVKSHPNDILTIKIHQKINQVAYQTARTDLLELEKHGWIKSIKKGKTFYFIPADKLWQNLSTP